MRENPYWKYGSITCKRIHIDRFYTIQEHVNSIIVAPVFLFCTKPKEIVDRMAMTYMN